MYGLLFLNILQHVSDPSILIASLSHRCQTCEIRCLDLFSLQDKGAFLLVLDSKSFEELARAYVPVNMAYGFHGTFDASA